MKTLLSIFKIYKIKKAYILNKERIEIVIVSRDESLSMARWINFTNDLKKYYKKEIDFLSLSEAKKIHGNLSSFTLIGGNENE